MRAVTRPLADVVGDAPDLNDVACGHGYLFVRDGVGVAGRGVARRVETGDAVAALAATVRAVAKAILVNFMVFSI